LYSNTIKNVKRRAAICGSTNHGEILRQDDENRYLVMEIEGVMDFDLLNSIDYIQLWAQARAVFLTNKSDSLFNQSDLKLILELSKGYAYMSTEEEAIHACFEYTPNPVKDIRFNEIIEVLKRNNYHLSEQKVASALKTLAPDRKIYKKKNGGKDRFYLIRHREGHTAPNSWVGDTGIDDI
jgi:predicted P-loop ATPase